MAISVGRIVHYIPENEGEEGDVDCIAAIVTQVNSVTGETVDLLTFPPGQQPVVVEVVAEGENEPNTWHWPELVL